MPFPDPHTGRPHPQSNVPSLTGLHLLGKLHARLSQLKTRQWDQALVDRICAPLANVRQRVPGLPHFYRDALLKGMPEVQHLVEAYQEQERDAAKQAWKIRTKHDACNTRAY